MHHHCNIHSLSRLLGVVAGVALMGLPLVATAEEAASHAGHQAMSHQTPAWAEQLKGQTVMEDAMEGRPERAMMVDMQHQRIMRQLQQDPQVQQVNTGMYNTMSMMHQYGAGGQ